MNVLLFRRGFRRWLHWRLPFWQYPVQPVAEAASEQTRFRSVNNIWAFDEFAHIDNWIVYPFLSSCCDTTDWFILTWFYSIPLYFILNITLINIILIVSFTLSWPNFQCTFTCVFYVSLSRTIVYMYICIYLFIYLFIESRWLATFLVLMLFVLQCTDYRYNYHTLTLTLTGQHIHAR